MTLYITTAGWDRHTLCYELWEYAQQILDGLVDDPKFLACVYAAAPDDDWTDEATWRKAMPALGDFCSLDFIRGECDDARRKPHLENRFRQLYLNQWTESVERFIAVERWKSCGGAFDPAILRDATAFGGLDLSQTRDLTSFQLAFPRDDGKGFRLLGRYWAPEEGEWRDNPTARELYLVWAKTGALTLCPGEVIDYQLVEEEIVALCEAHDVQVIFADKQMALHLCLRLRDVHGIEIKFLPQTASELNGPTRELERLVLAGEIHHGDDPVLAWCVGNATVRRNSTGLIFLDKRKSSGRIDGAAALVNALAGALSGASPKPPSIYETRGFRTL